MAMTDAERRQVFEAGYATACANLARDHGETTLAAYLLQTAGLDVSRIETVLTDTADIRELWLTLEEIK